MSGFGNSKKEEKKEFNNHGAETKKSISFNDADNMLLPPELQQLKSEGDDSSVKFSFDRAGSLPKILEMDNITPQSALLRGQSFASQSIEPTSQSNTGLHRKSKIYKKGRFNN